jgi:hypothetical protein
MVSKFQAASHPERNRRAHLAIVPGRGLTTTARSKPTLLRPARRTCASNTLCQVHACCAYANARAYRTEVVFSYARNKEKVKRTRVPREISSFQDRACLFRADRGAAKSANGRTI